MSEGKVIESRSENGERERWEVSEGLSDHAGEERGREVDEGVVLFILLFAI